MERNGGIFWWAAILAAGLAVSGWFVGDGFYRGRAADRYVTVKGVAERDVEADIALWPLHFVATNDELSLAQQAIEKSQTLVLTFLQKHGIDPHAVEMQKLDVTDMLADRYRSTSPGSRYIISQTLMVRTNEPDLVRKASQDIGELVDAGVVLSNANELSSGPTYLFSKLNDIKPEMIAEATANARRAADQFAKDSGSAIGGIRQASQGVFVILPRDRVPEIQESSQFHKTVRVVSTVEYYLKD